MRKICVGTILLAIAVIQIFALDPVQFEVIRRFQNGNGLGEFRYYSVSGMGLNPSGPEGLAYVNGSFYITDNVNKRIVKVDRDGEWKVFYSPVEPGIQLIRQGKILFDFYTQGEYRIYDIEKNSFLRGGSADVGDSSFFFYTVVAGDVILVQAQVSNNNPQYHSFFLPENFDGELEYRNPQDTISFLIEEYEGIERFTVDDDGYIFWNGNLVAPYGYSFSLFHWKTRNPPELWQRRVSQGLFVGWDTNNNSYWNLGRAIVVINPEGQLVTEFFGENINAYEKSQFALTPEGTLYCLSYNVDRDEFELMKLDRFW